MGRRRVEKTAFLDLTDEGLSLYTFDGGRRLLKTGSLPALTADASPEGAVAAGPSYLSLPLSLLNFRILEMPFSDRRKVRELVPFEIDNLVLGGHDDIVYDVCILGENEGKSKVLVAYVLKETLREILDRLRLRGFDPKAVTSLELAAVLGSAKTAEDVAPLLIESETLSEDRRTAVAAREIGSPTLDLRRGELAYTADTDRTVKVLRVSAILAALVIFFIAADVGLKVISLRAENRSIGEEIRKTYQGLFPADKKITDELLQLKAHLKEMKDKEAAFVGLSPLQRLLDLTRISRPGLTLTAVMMERDTLTLKGECPSLSDVQKLKDDLDLFLSGVAIADTKPAQQNRTAFTITARGVKT